MIVSRLSLALLALCGASAVLASPSTRHVSTCVKPPIRKEWRELDRSEQTAFISAVKCLATKPHIATIAPDGSQPDVPPVNTSANMYDDFVYAHMDGVIRNHFTGVFLAWHRWFLHTMEDSLRTQCNFKGSLPYWDWSRDVKNIPKAPVFTSDRETGFGTFNPNETDGFAVRDGAFGKTVRTYPTPHLVGRSFRPQPFLAQIFPFEFNLPKKFAVEAFTPSEVRFITTHFTGNYADFQAYMDGTRAEGMHNAAHLMINGDMSNIAHSPNDPIFFLHHANLDRIWADWQAHDSRNAFAVGGGTVQNLTNYDEWPAGSPPLINGNEMLHFSGLTPIEPRVKDVLDTTGGLLCYKYST